MNQVSKQQLDAYKKYGKTLRRKFYGVVSLFVYAMVFALVVATVFNQPQPTNAAITKLINFQGKLTNNDASSTNVADGNYTIEFKMYSALSGGSALWTETWDGSSGSCPEIAVTNGVFNVKLGGCNSSFPDFSGGSMYVSVNVEGDGEMSPRKQIGSTVYAMMANGVSGDGTVQNTVQSTTALTVARSGTDYAFQVDTNTASSATGLKVTSAAAGSGLALNVISSGTNEALTLNSKGTGEISIGSTSTGNINIGSSGTGDILLAGGSSSTGCTVANSTGNLTCTGNISGASTGTMGYWSRSGTLLSPATAGDDIALPTGDFIGLSASTARLVFNDAVRDNVTLTDGDLLFSADNTWDVGATGATRPRTVYVGTSVVAPLLTNAGALSITTTASNGDISLTPNGTGSVLIPAGTNFGSSSNAYIEFQTSGNNMVLNLDGNQALNIVNVATNGMNAYFSGRNITRTTGTSSTIETGSTFAPTSGTGSVGFVYMGSTVNQTGSATGISRGFFAAPTITSAYDFRAFDATYTIAGALSGSTNYGSKIALTNNQTTNANTVYGQHISFTDAGSLANTVTGLYVDATTANTSDTTYAAILQGGNVGIGTSSPAARLHVSGTDNFSDYSFLGQTNNAGAVIDPTYATDTGDDAAIGSISILNMTNSSQTDPANFIGASGSVYKTGTATLPAGSQIIGGAFTALLNAASGTTPTAIGTASYVIRLNANTITNASGGAFGFQNFEGSGTTSSVTGITISQPISTVGHTITDTYGIYIGDQVNTAGTQTNTPYGIYQTGSSNYNYFAGNVGIGDTSPAALLTVGSGDLFQVNSSGAIAAATGITSSGTITFSGLGGGGTQCVNVNNSGVLGVTTCGGALTPWTSDIDADGYDLNDLSNLLFRETTGAPAGTDVAIFRDNSGDLNLNSLSTKSINLQVAGTDEYNFSSTALAMNSNNITGVGTNITGAAGLTLSSTSADLTLASNTSGNITLAPASTGSVQITSGVTTGTGTSSGMSMVANSLTSGTGLDITTNSLTSGSLVNLSSTSTAAASSTQTVLNVSTSGANGTSSQLTVAGKFSNTHTGTSSTNYGIQSTASGGTNSTGARIVADNSTGILYGADIDARNFSTATTTMRGINVNAGPQASALGATTVTGAQIAAGAFLNGGTVTTAYGVDASLSAYNTASITTGSIIRAYADDAGAATYGTLYGLNLSNWGALSATTTYGIYMDTSIDQGATRYALYSSSTSNSYMAGNLGLGDVSPAALLTVGNGDLFQVNSSGAIAAVVGITNTGAQSTTVQSATALTVARSGTDYALQVDTNTASSATGLKVTSAAAGSGIALAAISSGTNENLTLNAKGSGSISIGAVSTGDVLLAGGSGSTGCTVGNAAGTFACTSSGAFSTALTVGNNTATSSGGVLTVTTTSSSDFVPGTKNIYTQTATGSLTGAYGFQNLVTSTAVVAGGSVGQNLYGNYISVDKSGADTATGTYNVYGDYVIATNTGRTDVGTVNTYGGYFAAVGDTAGTSRAIALYAAATSADNNYAAIFNGGQVVINGTTGLSGNHPLSIYKSGSNDDGNIALQNSYTSGYVGVDFFDASSSWAGSVNWGNSSSGFANSLYMQTSGASPILFITGASSERMRVHSDGNIGIATTAPDKRLEINSADGNNLRLTYNDSNGTATNYADLLTTSAGALTVQPSGFIMNIGGGTTRTAMRFLEPSGTGTDYAAIQANANVTTSYTWTLPAADASGCIQSNGSGTLSIAACGGSSALDGLTAATTDDAAILSGDNTIEWNWALTSAASKGFTIGESAASTGGSGDQHVFRIDTASGSTAGPLEVVSNSADGGDIEFNLASAGDFEIQDNGTAFATFSDSGQIGFAVAPVSDYLLSMAGTTGNDHSRVINITQANDAAEDSTAINLVNTANPGTISTSITRTVQNIANSLTPTITVNAAGASPVLDVYGISDTVSLGSVTLADVTGANSATITASSLRGSLSFNPIINDTGSTGVGSIVGYGAYTSVTGAPTLTSVTGPTSVGTYGGYFSNTATSAGNANLTYSAIGIQAIANGNLTTTGATEHYGGLFLSGGTADTNYGIYVDVNGATNNYAAIFTGGNVGIGVTTPTSLLHIQQSADSTSTSGPIALDLNSVGAAGELTASSGLQTFARIAPVINQSSTASYRALDVNVTQTAVSGVTGLNRLADFRADDSSRLAIRNDGSILMQNAANLVSPISSLGTFQNHLVRSEEFDNASWVKTNVSAPTANTQTAPDGSTRAESLATSSSGGDVCQWSGTAAGSGTFTFSVWARSTSGTQNFDMRVDAGATSCATANNVTGTAVTHTATTSWQRFTVTQTFSSATGNVKARIFPGGTGGTGTVYAWGAQLDQASSAQGYAFTTSGALTNTNRGQTTLSNFATASGFTYGGRHITTLEGSIAASSTTVGQLIRVIDNATGTDDTATVRGLEVQSYSGTNINGINTAIAGFGYTFGVHAVSTGQANESASPAAVFADLDNGSATTQGNAIRAYSDNLTSADLVLFYQESSSFTGNGLEMNFGNNSGSFTGNFISLQKAGTQSFHVDDDGSTFVSFTGGGTAHAVCHANNGNVNDDELVDCTSGPSADYAEMYPVASGIEAGDVVATGTRMVNTYNATEDGGNVDWNSVKGQITELVKSETGYQTNLIGVVSDNYSDFSTTGYNIKPEDNPKSIALAGRVLVNVTTENGPIFPGDYLTSSRTQPGKAMKALSPGMTIGKALSSYSGTGVGQVMVYVDTAYYNPTVLLDASGNVNMNMGTSGTTLIAQTSNQAAYIINQQGSGDLLAVQQNGMDRLLIGNNGSFQLNTTPTAPEDAILQVKADDVTKFSINAFGDIFIQGVIINEDDSFAGSIATKEDGMAEVIFSRHLGTGKPAIQLTVEAQIPVFAQIYEFKTDEQGNYTGFVIKTFDMISSPIQAIVHYNVTGKQEGYITYGTITVPEGGEFGFGEGFGNGVGDGGDAGDWVGLIIDGDDVAGSEDDSSGSDEGTADQGSTDSDSSGDSDSSSSDSEDGGLEIISGGDSGSGDNSSSES